jgi:tetratricopeptide (TPR) repeat protein
MGSTAETLDGGDAVGRSGREGNEPVQLDQLDIGTAVGRYVVEGVLGMGGMGVVYAARDPGLDRSVAVKVMRPWTGRRAEHGQRRLLREAQALAKLSHTAVVTVFDVGLHDGAVFVAMELLRGDTLTGWLRAARSPAEILRVFGVAGLGLAAAHDAALVHRDFKPDNVFVCSDGRVCVTDFGLARTTVDDSSSGEIGVTAAMPTADAILRTDGVAGTPAYMAPEQHSGLDTSAKSDQFAFCVALYEALFHQRPFAGETATRIAVEVLEGRVRPPPRTPGVSRAVARAILRGLLPDPSDRWPSMRDLLAALAPARGRRAWLLAAGASVAIASVAIARMPSATSCEGATAAIDAAWNPARVRTLADAFAAAAPTGATVFADLRPTLDAHAQSLRSAAHESCASRRDLPTFDVEHACLSGQTHAFASLLDALAKVDAKSLDRAALATAELVDPRACTDPALAARNVAPPSRSASTIDAVRARLAIVAALYDTGHWDEAIALARPLLAEAEEIGWEPLVAEVAEKLGHALGTGPDPAEGERLTAHAYWKASASGYDRLAAIAATEMMYMVGVRGGRHDEAIAWEEHAAAAVARLGPDSPEEGTLLLDRAVLEQARGNFDDAYALAEQARDIRTRLRGAAHVSVAAAEQNMGAIRIKQGRLDDARVHLERAKAGSCTALGTNHPQCARIEMNLGAVAIKSGDLSAAEAHLRTAIASFETRDTPNDLYQGLTNLSLVQRKRGDLDGAAASLERALAAAERALGKQHTGYASVLTSLANLSSARGEHERALALNREALGIREKSLGVDHEELAYPLGGIANELVMLGRHAEALPIYRRQLELLTAKLGEQHARTAMAHLNLGKVLHELGDETQATREVEQSLTIYRAVLPADHPEIAAALVELSRARLDAGHHAEAVELATDAEAMLQRTPGEPPAHALARFALARALWAANGDGDRKRAENLLRTAKAELATMPNAKLYLGLIDAWLAKRG